MSYNIIDIPNLWKIVLRQQIVGNSSQIGIEKIPTGLSLSKYSYWESVEQQYKNKPTALAWETELRTTVPDWNKILISPFRITVDTKLQYFQYRCIHKLITTNLARSKYSDVSDACTFFRLPREKVLHIFWDCNKIQRIRRALEVWVKKKLQVELKISPTMVIFCNYQARHAELINVLILIFKHYTHATKCSRGDQRPLYF